MTVSVLYERNKKIIEIDRKTYLLCVLKEESFDGSMRKAVFEEEKNFLLAYKNASVEKINEAIQAFDQEILQL